MAEEITFRLDASVLRKHAAALRKAAGGEMLDAMRPFIFPLLVHAQNEMRENVDGRVLKRRTGTLYKSIKPEKPFVQGDTLVGRVGSIKEGPTQRIANFLIHGGTIPAKTTRFLPIPLPAAQTSSGAARYHSPLRETLKAAFPGGTFVAKGVLFGKLGKTPKGRLRTRGGTNVVPLFALKRSVTIKPHDFVSGPQARLLDRTQKLVGQFVAGKLVERTP